MPQSESKFTSNGVTIFANFMARLERERGNGFILVMSRFITVVEVGSISFDWISS